MAAIRQGKLDDAAMEAAAEVPESIGSLTSLSSKAKFQRGREARNNQPNMPPIASNEGSSFPPEIHQTEQSGSEYRAVPLHLIDDNPYNARTEYDHQAIEKLALSIAKDGQLQPGIATVRGVRYVLIGGHYRKKALAETGIGNMKLVIREGVTYRDLYRLSFKENAERHPQSVIDNAYAWKNLLEKGVYQHDSDICDAIGVSKGQVSKTLALLRMSPDMIEFVRKNPDLGMSILYELYQLELSAGTEVAIQTAQKVVDGHATRDFIVDLRTKMTTQKPRKQYATSRQYVLKGGAGELGKMKEWDDGRVVMDLKIEDAAERAAFVEEIKRRFKVS